MVNAKKLAQVRMVGEMYLKAIENNTSCRIDAVATVLNYSGRVVWIKNVLVEAEAGGGRGSVKRGDLGGRGSWFPLARLPDLASGKPEADEAEDEGGDEED